jgi:hypothetical protein
VQNVDQFWLRKLKEKESRRCLHEIQENDNGDILNESKQAGNARKGGCKTAMMAEHF